MVAARFTCQASRPISTRSQVAERAHPAFELSPKPPSLVWLGTLRRGSKSNDGLTIETRKRVKVRSLFVRLAADHCKPAERTMPNRRPQRGGHSGSSLEKRYLLGSRVCRSAQYNVAAKMPKAAAISATMMISVGIDVLPSFREHDAGKLAGGFDPVKFAPPSRASGID